MSGIGRDDRGLRVAIVVPVFPQLSETFIANKAVGLVDRGWDVQIVCASSTAANWDAFGPDHPVQRLRDRVHTTVGARSARAVPDLIGRTGALAVHRREALGRYVTGSRFLRRPIVRNLLVDEPFIRLRPDIIHFEFGPAAVGRMHLRELVGCAVTVSFRGSDLNVIGLDDEPYYRDVWDHADGIHVLGQALVDQALRRGAPDPARLTVIHPALDTAPIVVAPHRVDAVNERNPLRILSVGRLHWTKGYLDAIDAVAALRDRGVPVEHRIVGGGDLAGAISFWRHERDLDDVVELVGPTSPSDVEAHYRWADVFLHAAVTEGFCNAVLEAQAHGLPVVCTDAGGLPENVIDGETGIIVPRRTPLALADGLERLARDTALLGRLGTAGRTRAERSFRIEDQLDAWEHLYRAAANRRTVAVAPRSGPTGATRVRIGGPPAAGPGDAPESLAMRVEPEPLRVWAGDLTGIDVDDRSARLALNPIVRAHLDDRLDADARAARYGSLLTHYRLTDIDEAEIAVLPRSFDVTSADDLRRRVDQAETNGLRTLVAAAHDLEPLLPSASMVLLHPGPTRGAQPLAAALAIPFFFADRASGLTREDGALPTVAFCGQAAVGWPASAVQTSRRALDRAINGWRPARVTPPVRGHVRLRARAIDHLRNDPRIDDRFVIRDRYRAGAVTQEDRARTQQEFDDNLRSATYALCVRGTGNFSARFYEALSFGRIPVFVDTDCVLPFEDEIDWRTRCVWVDESEVDHIADILVADHAANRSSPDRTEASVRRLWEERLTQDGFFRHVVTTVRDLCR